MLPETRKIVKEELDSQLRPVGSEIRRLDEKMGSVRIELKADASRVDEMLSSKIGAVDQMVTSMSGQFDLAREVERQKVEFAAPKGK